MSEKTPSIGVVIIGVNVEKCVADCIRSIQSAEYPIDLIEIVYVDGGSTDKSVEIATDFQDVTVIELKDRHPTPGRGRNAGWRSLDTPFIQFMDADTLLDSMWFSKALPHFENRTVAVCGILKERFPDKNIFHVIAGMDWRYEIGPCRYFGGNVLIKREILESTEGYDGDIVAGEDPELSYRIRQKGWRIIRIDSVMAMHDINMETFRQYFKRAFRSGYAYGEICLRFIRNREKLWVREFIRIIYKTLLPIVLVIAGILSGYVLAGIVSGLLVLFRPFFSIKRLKYYYNQSWKYTILYVFHSALVVYPQFLGILRYAWGRLSGNPLRNKIKL